MKKIFTSLMLCLISVLSYATGYDTIYYKPNEPASLELAVDYEKYPYLKGVDVSWYVGFKEVDAGGQKLIARAIKDSETTIVDGKTYLVNKDLGESWDPGYPSIRTLVVFYGHKIVSPLSTRSGEQYFTKEDFKDIICDTTAVIHLLKELDDSYIESMKLNGRNIATTEVHAGDTVRVEAALSGAADSLDIRCYSLLEIDGKDTVLLASSKSSKFEYIPEESHTVQLAISNDINSYVYPWKRNIEVPPDFEVQALRYDITSGKDLLLKTEDYVDSVSLYVVKGDSLALHVINNAEESKYDVVCSWNLNGKQIPDSSKANGFVLEVSDFQKEKAGSYNCVISDKEGNQIKTVTFFVSYKSPTANEVISASKMEIRYINGAIQITGAEGDVCIYDISGKQVAKIKYENSFAYNNIFLPLGIYIATDGKNTKKLLVN